MEHENILKKEKKAVDELLKTTNCQLSKKCTKDSKTHKVGFKNKTQNEKPSTYKKTQNEKPSSHKKTQNEKALRYSRKQIENLATCNQECN